MSVVILNIDSNAGSNIEAIAEARIPLTDAISSLGTVS